jgi:hypothetical protein
LNVPVESKNDDYLPGKLWNMNDHCKLIFGSGSSNENCVVSHFYFVKKKILVFFFYQKFLGELCSTLYCFEPLNGECVQIKGIKKKKFN